MERTNGEKVFGVFNSLFLGLFALAAIYPFIYVMSASISLPQDVLAGKVMFFPTGFHLDAYNEIFADKNVWVAYGNTVFYTVAGTALSILITAFGAYPLSKRRLVGRRAISLMVMITLWFNPGMIPFFLNVRDLGLTNSRIGYIITFACHAFYVIIMRTFFESIPDSMEESAAMDGANHFTILFRIYIPLSIPAIATLSLYYAVAKWNAFFWAMVMLQENDKVPLQVLLKKLIVMNNPDETSYSNSDYGTVVKETLIYATIAVSVLPILAVYPYIQKFFIKGIMIGSVKG